MSHVLVRKMSTTPTTATNTSVDVSQSSTPLISSPAPHLLSSLNSSASSIPPPSPIPFNLPNSNNNSNSNTPAITTTVSSSTGGSSSSFLDIVESWKQFGIDKKKGELDSFVSQIASMKEECVQSRKVLAKQTQDFRKVSDEDKLKLFGTLLKLYQEEVDKLTKRSKYSESCFFGVYKDLSELNDPVPALKAALDEYNKVDQSTSKLEIENRKLQLELAGFKKDFQEIQNQEVTIRRLEDKVKDYETKFESTTLEKVQSRENELRIEYKSKIHNLKDRNQELTRQNSQLQDDLNKVSKSHDQNQSSLFDLKVKHDEEISSKQSEIEMLSNEMERVTTKLSTLQAENSSIREESMREKSAIQPLVKRIADLELELLQKDGEVSNFSDSINDLKLQLKQSNDYHHQVETLLQVEKQKVERMDKHIQSSPSLQDYESVKKELEQLQAIVGNEEVQQQLQQHQQNDKILKDKNRQLENDLTKHRLTIATYESELQDYKQKLSYLENIKNDQTQLIQKLEEDISHQDHPSNNSTLNNSNNNLSSLINESSGSNQNNSPILSNSTDQQQQQKSESEKMMDIVISQRDRFKLKIIELENDKNQFEKNIETLKSETSSLKQDNIKLFEKIRFLQSYENNNRGGKMTKQNSMVDLERGATGQQQGVVDKKYEQLYEDSINPFNSFSKKEKYRRYKEMNSAEQVILNASRFFLSNKYSRIFLFVYSILLHLLVFYTLYYTSTTTQEIHELNYGNQQHTPPPFNSTLKKEE
ncbi:C-terminal CASP domain-containing protein [Cavenderia fasciculata]|uniref:Protein CASP n=1 Tax=Cavenderia fasciculata TaxID=261658 RepID=F4Q0R3_CACFS|nr:C-terminal CASP domain-containing protein [Cavenderia fasciculata]EGG18414.1 C-terminal CASP domain-containing protein [Cavenderia fasciculata]|eukprot:XP_004366318.1 C-terminal CASP domain-containing protein [Cavenderia fasciculata]